MEPNDETKQTERHLGLRLLNLSQFLLPDSIDINSTPKIHVTIQRVIQINVKKDI